MKAKYFAVLFVLMTILAATSASRSVRAQPPSGPLLVYRTRPSNVNVTFVTELAVNVFNLTSPSVTYVEGMFVVNNTWPRFLSVSEASGGIWYCDYSKCFNQSCLPTSLPAGIQAVAIASSFITGHSSYLMPATASIVDANIGYVSFAKYNLETNSTETNAHNAVEVSYIFQTKDGYPTYGPGAKMIVYEGQNGEIVGFTRTWREIDDYGYYSAFNETQARQTFLETSRLDPEQLNISMTWGYYCDTVFKTQDFVQPVWIVGSDFSLDGEPITSPTLNLPATVFSPQATVTSPPDGSKFNAGQNIQFSASASFGTPPYTYMWQSNVDGILYQGSNPTFTISLSGANKEEHIVPHTITLTVTDANGINASDHVSVTVEPTSVGGIYVPVDRLNVLLKWLTNPSVLAVTFVCSGTIVFSVLKKKGKTALLGLALLALIVSSGLLMQTQAVFANGPYRKDSFNEVGAEGVTLYNGLASDLPYGGAFSATDFRTQLQKIGNWNAGFTYTDYGAWEEDFKYRYSPDELGGADWEMMDTTDFGYFSGHGNQDGIGFVSNIDSNFFNFANARWGGNDAGDFHEEAELKWMALQSCMSLFWDNGGIFSRWSKGQFCGLHQILGFDTPSYDSDVGYWFGWALRFYGSLLPIIDCWIWVTTWTQPTWVYLGPPYNPLWSGLFAGALWAEKAAGTNVRYEYLPGMGYVSPDPWPPYYLVFGHWLC